MRPRDYDAGWLGGGRMNMAAYFLSPLQGRDSETWDCVASLIRSKEGLDRPYSAAKNPALLRLGSTAAKSRYPSPKGVGV